MKIVFYYFDGTIYDGDSTFDFFMYLLKKRKKNALLVVPVIIKAAFAYLTGKGGLTAFKSRLFEFMYLHYEVEKEATLFWNLDSTMKKINSWFLSRNKKYYEVIASASPEFELLPISRKLSVDTLICTRCDSRGTIIGSNCKSSEKIERIEKEIGPVSVHAMYTDNCRADGPLLAIAQEQYLVKKGRCSRIQYEHH